MGRWMKPDVYPLVAAMAFVTSLSIFQLTRNALLNPDVRIKKSNRTNAIPNNAEEAQKYADHGFRKFLSRRPPEVFATLNTFFAGSSNKR